MTSTKPLLAFDVFRYLLALLLWFSLNTGLWGQDTPPRLNESFQPQRLAGWELHVHQQLLEQKPEKTALALKLLKEQLEKVVEVVPAPALKKLQSIRIWISPTYPKERARAEYHPGKAWLKKNGRLEIMVKAVEISNVDIFEKECLRMPMLALHELSHAYHDQVLGFDNEKIKELYNKAKDSGLYERVERWHGPDRPKTTERAYAMSTPQEYFAESSEAYFGINDFFPFNRDELERHDPAMHALLRELWGDQP